MDEDAREVEDAYKRYDEHRRSLPWSVLIVGSVDKGRECWFEVWITSPPAAPSAVPGIVVPGRKLRAIIDTGATDSAIRYDLARELGLPFIGQREVDTASSGEDPVVCPTALGAIAIRDGKGTELAVQHEFICQDMTDDVLFGMDLLKGGILTIDLVHGRWDWRYINVAGLEFKPVDGDPLPACPQPDIAQPS